LLIIIRDPAIPFLLFRPRPPAPIWWRQCEIRRQGAQSWSDRAGTIGTCSLHQVVLA